MERHVVELTLRFDTRHGNAHQVEQIEEAIAQLHLSRFDPGDLDEVVQ
jgi:hypothetical protein